MDSNEVKEAECNNDLISFICEYDCSVAGGFLTVSVRTVNLVLNYDEMNE